MTECNINTMRGDVLLQTFKPTKKRGAGGFFWKVRKPVTIKDVRLEEGDLVLFDEDSGEPVLYRTKRYFLFEMCEPLRREDYREMKRNRRQASLSKARDEMLTAEPVAY